MVGGFFKKLLILNREEAHPQLRWEQGTAEVPWGSSGGPGQGICGVFAPKTPQPWQVPQPRAGAQLSPVPLDPSTKESKKTWRAQNSPAKKFIPREEKKAEQNSEAPAQDFQTSWDLVTQAVNLTASCHLLLVGFTLNFSI